MLIILYLNKKYLCHTATTSINRAIHTMHFVKSLKQSNWKTSISYHVINGAIKGRVTWAKEQMP